MDNHNAAARRQGSCRQRVSLRRAPTSARPGMAFVAPPSPHTVMLHAGRHPHSGRPRISAQGLRSPRLHPPPSGGAAQWPVPECPLPGLGLLEEGLGHFQAVMMEQGWVLEVGAGRLFQEMYRPSGCCCSCVPLWAEAE